MASTSTVSEGLTETEQRGAAVHDYILHHIADAQEWHLPFLPAIHLPEWMTLHAVMLVIGAVLVYLLFGRLYKAGAGAPAGITNFLEVFVLFVRDEISVANLGEEDGKRMAPLFLTFFCFIVILNLMGLIPLFATATGNIHVTGSLAAVTLAFMLIGGMVRHGPVGFFKAFMPHGVPWPILILITPLELVGVFIKCFALMIRLFANMMAGHIVVFSLIGLLVTYGAFALPALGIALGIYLMEIFIAFLQAYIFTLLSAMFIGQVYHPAH